MSTSELLPRLYFSYSQFMVYDATVRLPGCAWTDGHSAQGFARRESVVNFGTLLEFGSARTTASVADYRRRDSDERVIAVPFLVVSGRVCVDGPEEIDIGRCVDLPPGDYRLVAAQRVVNDEEQEIDLFFEARATPLDCSAILVADAELQPPSPLLEVAGIAGHD
jgi:hypothetical protein